ncbi:hypothetical protein HDV02_004203 [Globomyces sp. JEL0801]|nr:hypothetical protein HDV02_004203 [Globomyces sp. JEL0801]
MSVSDLSTKDSFGATPLHFASCRNLHENVSVLLSAGCNPNITNNDLKKPSDVTTNSDIMYSLQNEEARLAEEIAKQTKRPVTSGKKKRKQSAKTIQRVSPSKSKSSNSIDMVARSKSSVTLTTKSKEDTKSSTPKTPISTKIKSKPKLVDSNPKLTDSLLKSANQISQPTSQKNSNGDVSQLKSFQNGLFHDVEELAGELKDGMTIKKVTNKPKVTVA